MSVTRQNNSPMATPVASRRTGRDVPLWFYGGMLLVIVFSIAINAAFVSIVLQTYCGQ